MNIVYIAYSDIPSTMANSVNVMKMCQAFAENGHTVTLIAPEHKDKNEKKTTDIYEYYGITKRFEILFIPRINNKKRVFHFSFFAAKAAKRIKPDLIYTRSLSSCLFALNLKSKIILEYHTPFNKRNKLQGFLLKKTIYHKNFYKLILISKSLKHWYEEFLISLQDKIQVVPSGADPIPDNLTPITLTNSGKRMQIGYVGNLYKGKGMEVLSKLAPLCSWADFHVVGGTQADINFWQTKCYEIKNLILHGYIPHNVTPSYMLAFDVLLLPNQENVIILSGNDIGQWTSPIKAFEYMSAKKPILASDLPVLREIFQDNVNAVLVHPEKIELWVEGLRKISTDIVFSQKIACNAYNDFIKKYTWSVRAQEVLK